MPAEALLIALRHVWLTLTPLQMPMALMGGLALATWKYVRATRDIDLLLGMGEQDLAKALDVLGAAGIRPKHNARPTRLGQLDIVQFLYEPPETFLELQIDLLLGQSEYHQESLQRRVSTELPGLDVTIAVLRSEDLLLHKLLAGRILDRVDAASLLRFNRDLMEWEYLTRWSKRLGVTAELADAWQDAFPGEPLPG